MNKYAERYVDSRTILQKRVEKIIEWITDIHPVPASQTEIMQRYRIRKSEIGKVEEALMARRLVVVDPYPNTIHIKGSRIFYRKGEEEDWVNEDEILNEEEETENENSSESVYFAIAPDYNRMKIGWTTGSVTKRVAAVSQGSFARIFLFGSIKDRGRDYEQFLHRRFKDYRVMNEWFVASQIVRDVVRLAGFSVELHSIEVNDGQRSWLRGEDASSLSLQSSDRFGDVMEVAECTP